MARLHVRHRTGRVKDAVRELGQTATAALRASGEVAAAICKELLPGSSEVGWMSAVVVTKGATPPLWRRMLGFNLLTGIILAIVGYVFGHWVGGLIHAASLGYGDTGQNDISILLGYLFGVIGFLIGLGFANYPLRRMMGHPPTLAEH